MILNCYEKNLTEFTIILCFQIMTFLKHSNLINLDFLKNYINDLYISLVS